jgi:hypothetical protein
MSNYDSELDNYECDNCHKELKNHSETELKECLRNVCESRYENMMGDDL